MRRKGEEGKGVVDEEEGGIGLVNEEKGEGG